MESFEEGTALVRVYLAASLDEARGVEDALAATGVEFAVEVEEVSGRSLFGWLQSRRGAGFWVRETELDRAAGALERGGHLSGLVKR
jgi:hypothetical protein